MPYAYIPRAPPALGDHARALLIKPSVINIGLRQNRPIRIKSSRLTRPVLGRVRWSRPDWNNGPGRTRLLYGGDPSFAGQKIVKNKRVGQPSRWIVLRKQGITPRSLSLSRQPLLSFKSQFRHALDPLSWARVAHSVGRNKTGGKYNKDIITWGWEWEGKGTCVQASHFAWVVTFKSQLVTCMRRMCELMFCGGCEFNRLFVGASAFSHELRVRKKTDVLNSLCLHRRACETLIHFLAAEYICWRVLWTRLQYAPRSYLGYCATSCIAEILGSLFE